MEKYRQNIGWLMIGRWDERGNMELMVNFFLIFVLLHYFQVYIKVVN